MPCCKSEEYEWCKDLDIVYTDPESNEDYCLFHAPEDKKGISVEEFNKTVLQSIEQSKESGVCDLGGTVFPGDIDFSSYTAENYLPYITFYGGHFEGEALFSGVHFQKGADFGEVQFELDASFENTNFNGEANFYDVYMKGNADFRDAHFKGKSTFGSSYFEEDALFWGALFEGEGDFNSARFKGYALFINAKFKGGADFSDVHFEEIANFEDVSFQGSAALFSDCHFGGHALFRDAHFEENAHFDRVHFMKEANAAHAEFINGASFSESFFNTRGLFAGTKFLRYGAFDSIDIQGHIRFESVDLRRVSFLYIDFKNVQFVNCRWKEEKGRKVLYDEVALSKARDITSSGLSIMLEWIMWFFRKQRNSQLLSVKALYTKLKQKYKTEHDEGRASEWHYSEKEMERQMTTLRNPFQFIMLHLYWLSSGYAEAPVQAFIVLLALLGGFSVLFGMYGLDPAQFRANSLIEVFSLSKFDELFFNTIQYVTFEKLPKFSTVYPAGDYLKLLARILIPTQAALFVLALRNRFRR